MWIWDHCNGPDCPQWDRQDFLPLDTMEGSEAWYHTGIWLSLWLTLGLTRSAQNREQLYLSIVLTTGLMSSLCLRSISGPRISGAPHLAGDNQGVIISQIFTNRSSSSSYWSSLWQHQTRLSWLLSQSGRQAGGLEDWRGSHSQYVRREEGEGDISKPPGACLTFFGEI